MPGPGTYAITEHGIRAKSPGCGYALLLITLFRLGKSKKDFFLSESVDHLYKTLPGPGSYAVKPEIGSGPKYGIRPKTAYIRLDSKPGPGYYEVDAKIKSAKKAPIAVMGTAKRNALAVASEKKLVPGPGAYALSKSFDSSGLAYS